MSYTPPSGNAVNFTQIGNTYYASSGSAVTFSFVPPVPTMGAISGSVTSFVGAVFEDRLFTITSGSVFVPLNPYREFSIASGSLLDAITWQRNFDISSWSTPGIQSGSQAHLSLTSVLDYKIGNLQSRQLSISSSSSLVGDGISESQTQAIIRSRSTPRILGAYNVDVKIYMRLRSTVAFKQRSTAETIFSGSSLSRTSFVTALIKPTVFSVSVSSSPALYVLGLGRASFTIGTSSLGSFSGIFGTGTVYAISSLATPSFISSFGFSYIPLRQEDVDVVYAHTKQPSVFLYGV